MTNPSELSAEFILQLKHELEADMRLLEELPGRIEHRKKRYEAALLFAPAGFDPDRPLGVKDENKETSTAVSDFFLTAPGEHPVEGKLPSWSRAIQGVLDDVEVGLTHKDLLVKIREKHPTLPVSVGEKGFYNGVSKLMERGEIIKHGNQLYSSGTVEKFRLRGEALPEVSSVQTRAGSSGEIILSLLREHKAGLSAPDLKALLAEIPTAPASLKKHGHYIYNVLATLIGAGVVAKDGSLYKLA